MAALASLLLSALVLPLGFGLTMPAPVAATAASTPVPNLLRNPGFEAAAGWLSGWTVEDLNDSGPPYHYRLDDRGSGHGDARPRTGRCAIEIYSDGARRSVLWQPVELEPGRYRLAAWARSNGNTDLSRLQLRLGDQAVTVPAIAERYRYYYADFGVEQGGAYQAGFQSVSLGLALDDLSLTRLPAGGAPDAPYLYFDLCPTSPARSAGTQAYFRGQKQWVNCTVSCTDTARLHRPLLRLEVPEGVLLSGINEEVLRLWAYPDVSGPLVREERGADGAGGTCRQVVVALPRFVNGPGAPVAFGGFWVEVPGGGRTALRVLVEDHGRVVSEETIRLEPVDPPLPVVTPRRYKIVAYCVQGWTMSLAERLDWLPRQFAQAGMNVWSDYGLVPPPEQAEPGREEQVRARAAELGCVQEFWGNHSNLLETAGYVRRLEDLGVPAEAGMYQVGADGAEHRERFSLRYAADGGPAWLATAVAGHTYAVERPAQIGLPYRYRGFITDGLEGIPVSFDSLTLADFARAVELDPARATVAAVQGALAPQWASYNMALYARVAQRWSAALKQIDPGHLTANTLGSFGPAGASGLPLDEQMSWARGLDYTMPQWYATNFYGDAYSAILQQGLAAGVYGKQSGYADVIPLFNQTMGAGVNDPAAIRFHTFDLISASPVVKGVGYFIATNIFADARLMAEMAAVHALLSRVEDYYAAGVRADSLAVFRPTSTPPRQRGIDLEGLDAEFVPEVRTRVRLHRLQEGSRIALLTVVSHCNQGVGQAGVITLDLAGLVGGDARGKTVTDLLSGARRPLTAQLSVDTRHSHSLALLEVTAD